MYIWLVTKISVTIIVDYEGLSKIVRLQVIDSKYNNTEYRKFENLIQLKCD